MTYSNIEWTDQHDVLFVPVIVAKFATDHKKQSTMEIYRHFCLIAKTFYWMLFRHIDASI